MQPALMRSRTKWLGAAWALGLGLWLAACNTPFTPRPRAYYQLPLPARQYQVFDQPGYPYTFEFPAYARVVKDSLFFDEQTENPWWINLEFPSLAGKLHLSYKELRNNSLDSLVRDAYTLTNKHTVKAASINDSLLRNPFGASGIYFSVGGDVATATQFFLTDSSRHFLRGALYFEATPNQDSLAPVVQFVNRDLQHLIQTLRWR